MLAARDSGVESFILSVEELRARRGFRWRGFDDDVLPASGADMDFVVAEPARRAIGRVVDSADYGYPLRAGESRVEAAFAARMRARFGWDPDLGRTLVVDSLLQAFVACL